MLIQVPIDYLAVLRRMPISQTLGGWAKKARVKIIDAMKKLIIILTIFLSFQQSYTVEVVELKYMNNSKFLVDN